MKFIATNSDKIKTLPLQQGQLIFSRDDRVIYLDSDVRTEFTTFIVLDTEEERTNLISPVNGFYFIEETKILWRHINKDWFPLNEKPRQNIVFDEKPTTGVKDTLYIVNDKIYRWKPTQNKYIIVGDIGWEPITI